MLGDALDQRTYVAHVPPADTFVHLVGVSHPSPMKAAQFRSIDLASAREGVAAAMTAGVRHFVYVSVAQPAPVMKAYISARAEAEAHIRASGLNATILRPWYVLGPGHRWPVVLLPLYWIVNLVPATRETAQQLGLVTLRQMISTVIWGVENPSEGVRVLGVPQIRASTHAAAT